MHERHTYIPHIYMGDRQRIRDSLRRGSNPNLKIIKKRKFLEMKEGPWVSGEAGPWLRKPVRRVCHASSSAVFIHTSVSSR